MQLARLATAVTSALVLSLPLAGCGDPGTSASGGGQTPAASDTPSAAPATAPTGTTARTVAYQCASGREGSIAVDVPDLRVLAERINGIQPCEYDHGMSHATLVVTCRSGPRAVRLTGTDGRLTQPSAEALCLT